MQFVLQHLVCTKFGSRIQPELHAQQSPQDQLQPSTPELPPPITATRLPLNNGPSQCGQ